MTDDTRPADPAAKPVWPERAIEFGAHSYAWLMRPRVRLSVIGVTLLLVGGLVAMNSVWTLPLVVIGALMVGVAWIGHRLEGHFAVEWGEAGTQLAFNATVKPPRPTPELQAPGAPALEPGSDAAPEAAVIEGEAHTVEINVGELKALIAAAEASEASTDAVVQDIRIRRLADDDARTPRPSA